MIVKHLWFQDYELDGIDWKKVDFEDNQNSLDLFEKVLLFPIVSVSILFVYGPILCLDTLSLNRWVKEKKKKKDIMVELYFTVSVYGSIVCLDRNQMGWYLYWMKNQISQKLQI